MPIPLPNVKGATLEKVITWLKQYKDTPIPPEKEDDGERNSEDINEYDRGFMAKCKQDEIFEVMLAANYLDVKELLEVTVKTMANELKKCKDHLEIRKNFNIKNDF
ncbi:hypothetical protein PENTCL1PPCAC_20790, partial [Pristionchus entomophagus]